MLKTEPRTMRYQRSEAPLTIRADETLPPGICGRVSGVALTYDVIDTYETAFARGCAKRSIDERVAARKVPLLMDHDRSVKAHVGVVSTMTDTGSGLLMVADLFDTPDGRAALEYVKAVMAAGAATGLSIGFVPMRSEMVMMQGKPVQRFTEIALREVSLTPMPSVPGTEVTGARADAPEVPEITFGELPQDVSTRSDAELLEVAAAAALMALSDAQRTRVLAPYHAVIRSTPADAAPTGATRADVPAPHGTTTAPGTAPIATMDDRLAAVRATYLET